MAPFVESTLVLFNDTIEPGNYLAGNGYLPDGIAIDESNQQVGIPDAGSGDLTILNATTSAVVKTVYAGAGASGIAYDPTRDVYVVPELAANNVTIISASNGSVLATVPVGGQPRGIAYDSAQGECYIVNQQTGNVSVLNDTTMKVTATIAVQGYPFADAYDNATGQVFVSDYYEYNVSIINATTNSVATTVGVGGAPEGLLYDYQTRVVLVADIQGRLALINGSTDNVSWSHYYGPWAAPQTIALDPVNHVVYVTEETTANQEAAVENVTLANASTGDPIQNVSVGNTPFGIGYDSRMATVFVANSGTDNVSEISTSSKTVIATISVGAHPDQAVYDLGHGDLWISDKASNNLTVLNLTSNKVAAYVPTGVSPTALAYDPKAGQVLVTDQVSQNVEIINDTTFGLNHTVGASPNPVAAAYGARADAYYISTSLSGGALALLSPSNFSIYRNITTLGVLPRSAVVDSGLGEVVVADYGSGTVSIVSEASNTNLGNVVVGTNPLGGVYDSAKGEVFVTNAGSSSVSVVNVSGKNVVATVPVGDQPWGAAYDPAAGEVLVTNSLSGNVTVINDTTNLVTANIQVGAQPLGVEYDAANGLFYVANADQGTISEIRATNQSFQVGFGEQGLPSGTTWHITLGGTTLSSAHSAINFSEPNGTYAYSVPPVPGYQASPSSGTLTVSGRDLLVTVDFNSTAPPPPTIYDVTFTQVGLPVGDGFNATLNGSSHMSSGGPITFHEPNGTYAFLVQPVPGYVPSPSGGDLTVHGAPLGEHIAFSRPAPPHYSVTLTESGLPSLTAWSVTFNGTYNTSRTSTIGFVAPNGSYSFAVGTIAGYTIAPASGTLVVQGAAVQQGIVFGVISLPRYSISFVESGLPSGTAWSVTLGSGSNSSQATSIGFSEPNGTYAFEVTGVANYAATPISGSITVDGSSVSQAIAFTEGTSRTGGLGSSFGLPPILFYGLIGGGVALALIAAFILVRRRQRERSDTPVTSEPRPPGSAD